MHQARGRGHLRLVDDRPDRAAPAAPTGEDRRVERLYAQSAQLLDMQERAREVYTDRPPGSFAGLGALLNEVLPEADELAGVIARAAGLSGGDLVQLRASLLDPLTLPPRAVVLLGEAAALTLPELEGLAVRDHLALAASRGPDPQHASSAGATSPDRPGSSASWGDAVLVALREAWADADHDAPP